MRHAILASAALLMLSACGADEQTSGNSTSDYATGELPTADTVQRESEVHVARQPEGEDDEERPR